MTLVARIPRLPWIALAASALTALAMAGFAAAPAAATQNASCARQIVNDWYGDGKVDKIYEVHCYREAIRSLPVDVRDYSNAEEDILRALAYAKKGEPDPGPAGGKAGGGGGGSQTKGPTGHGGSTDATGGTDTESGGETVAAAGTDTSGPSSIPLPLIVLGGLAFLLLVAGGAGYVNRRMQAQPADDEPSE